MRLRLLGLWLLLPACVAVDRAQGLSEIARGLKERTGLRSAWRNGPPAAALVKQHIETLLRSDLSLEHAVELALLNNRKLIATYEGFGVAQAELVQAGLIRNPSISAWIGVPTNQATGLNLTFGLVQSFIDVALLPLKRSVAQAQFQQAQLKIVEAALALHEEVREAYVTLQASQQALAVHQAVLDASQASADLERRQIEAGNISALQHSTAEATYQQLKLEVARDEVEVIADRERLNRLLGLWGPQTQWTVTAPLPPVPAADPAFDHLEARAIERRADLEVARREVELLSRALALAERERVAGIFSLGVTAERKHDGLLLIGPTLDLELPIFDQRQAMIARLEAQQRQAQALADGLAIDVRSEVREGQSKLQHTRQAAEHYRTVLLPLQARIVELSQLHYNAMLLSVFQLLTARQAELTAQREYLHAVRDYWVAKFELERRAGGRLEETR